MSGSTNNNISRQNDQVRAQFASDRRAHSYQTQENQRRYEQAVRNRNLQQANYDGVARHRDETNRRNFGYQQSIQRQQYNVDRTAYNQSLQDYDTQTSLNSQAGAIAREAAERTRHEALISRTFGLEGQQLNYRENITNNALDRQQAGIDLRSATREDQLNTNCISATDSR